VALVVSLDLSLVDKSWRKILTAVAPKHLDVKQLQGLFATKNSHCCVNEKIHINA